jgi:uncharacterized protein
MEGRVIDIDTHVGPSLELLQAFATGDLAARWDELAPYLNTTADGDGIDRTTLRVNPIPFKRPLRTRMVGDEPIGPGAAGTLDNKTVARGTGTATPGVQHDNPKGRLEDMDTEGVDVHLIIPGTWGLAATAIDPGLACGLYDSYHRYVGDFCSADVSRLKSLVLLSAVDPERAVAALKEHGEEDWVAGAAIMLPEGMPIDDPGLEPIWDTLNDLDLPLVYHSFFYEAPYFPGYRDIWGNMAIARTAAHPWGAQRVLAYLLMSGMFDRWPNLRIGFSETGAGWLPYWLRRLDMHQQYLPSAVPTIEKTPMEYARSGHVFCGVQLYEGADMAKAIADIVSPDVIMYQSDFPHGECEYPESVNHAKSWSDTLGPDLTQKFLGGNAERFLRLK